ncbi:hypothetical protein RIF29_32482 [Crotalaria pallida]|uniref:Uncharacterized protein n=1 Tax=Crotalaria pallida TaxID=3830 RepID=A0AAN9HXQ7_CROPI
MNMNPCSCVLPLRHEIMMVKDLVTNLRNADGGLKQSFVNFPNDHYSQQQPLPQPPIVPLLHHDGRTVGGIATSSSPSLPRMPQPLPPPPKPKRKPWTIIEHKLFLEGIAKYGKGEWRKISRNILPSRTPSQIASHAQKYFDRQTMPASKKKRKSIHDMTLSSPPLVLPPDWDFDTHHQQQEEQHQQQGLQHDWDVIPWDVATEQQQEEQQQGLQLKLIPSEWDVATHQQQHQMQAQPVTNLNPSTSSDMPQQQMDACGSGLSDINKEEESKLMDYLNSMPLLLEDIQLENIPPNDHLGDNQHSLLHSNSPLTTTTPTINNNTLPQQQMEDSLSPSPNWDLFNDADFPNMADFDSDNDDLSNFFDFIFPLLLHHSNNPPNQTITKTISFILLFFYSFIFDGMM